MIRETRATLSRPAPEGGDGIKPTVMLPAALAGRGAVGP